MESWLEMNEETTHLKKTPDGSSASTVDGGRSKWYEGWIVFHFSDAGVLQWSWFVWLKICRKPGPFCWFPASVCWRNPPQLVWKEGCKICCLRGVPARMACLVMPGNRRRHPSETRGDTEAAMEVLPFFNFERHGSDSLLLAEDTLKQTVWSPCAPLRSPSSDFSVWGGFPLLTSLQLKSTKNADLFAP